MARLVKKCPCLRPQIEDDVQVLDYRHYSLTDVPGEVFNFERTLEELYIDSNQIQDLPRELFYCHGLRKLSISDNEITNIPPAISSLVSLEELDLSKNGIIDIPESIKSCKYLRSVDASVNPLGKLPDGFTQLLNLTQLYLNDTFLDYLPGNFGRLSKLKILEIRENHLKTLPKSFSRLTELEKLDIGHNEFTELPDVIGNVCNLLELWCDQNQITTITPTIGNLKQLMFLDASRNQLLSLPAEIEGCTSLADLHLTTNQLKELPDSLGNLSNLTTLKVDDNQLVSLPNTIGGLTALSELNVSINDLQDLPASLGLLRNLRTFYTDENQLEFIPAELGSCSGITVLSLRSNKLEYIPDEIGRIPHLRVLNISNNNLKYLPFTFIKLKELQALWMSENQTRPLIPLQSEYDRDTGRKILTCYLLPQGPPRDSGEVGGDTDSFHASMWEEERRHRQMIHFEFGDESDADGKLIRCPTPYPKEMREKLRHVRNLQMRQNMLTNGEPNWNKGEDNPAYEETSSMERLNLLSNEITDGGRHNKSSSPSLKDSHKLYKYDKEKFAKDKARLRHTAHFEEEGHGSSHQRDGKPDKSNKSPDSKSHKNEDDDGGFSHPRGISLGSAPDIPAQSLYAEKSSRPVSGFSYCSPSELSKSLSHQSEKHHHSHSHHSHRHHRMRDYDSDTGYRSDQEVLRLRRQQQLMYGIGTDPANRRDNQSDIIPAVRHKSHHRDGYSSDLEGYKNRPIGINCVTAPIQQQHSANSLPYNLNQQTQNHSSQKTYLTENVVRNDELYSQTVGNTKTVSNQNLPVGGDSVGGLSSSINLSYPPRSPSPLHKSRILDQSTPISPNPTHAFSFPCNHNNPSSLEQKPMEKPVEWRKDLFNTVEQCRINNSEQPKRYLPNPQSHPSNFPPEGSPVPPPYKPAPPYSASPVQRQLPSTPNRASPYGRQLRQSPLREFQRMPDIQEHTDSAKNDMKSIPEDLSRSRSQNGYHHGDYQNQGTPNMGSDKSISVSKPYCPSQHLCYENPSALTFQYGSDLMSRTPVSQVISWTNDSWTDPNALNQRTPNNLNDSPLSTRSFHARNSPLIGVVDRLGGIASSNGYLHYPPRNMDNSFQDVPSKFDDIAIFKSADPASQMSSSTDSGYVQGQNTFDKYSGGCRKSPSQGSPSPDQYNSESPYTASPHQDMGGPSSREPTPVNTLSEIRSGSDGSPRDTSNMRACERFRVTITKNPGLGFSIAGGLGSFGNPYRPGDMGIFVTKIQPDGPAAISLQPGDKILEVNGINFGHIEHDKAVSVLKNSNAVSLYVERDSPS